MNNKQLWCDEELSRMLEELGCESQFDERHYCTCNNQLLRRHHPTCALHVMKFHFSDCLLPENAKKIWNEGDNGDHFFTGLQAEIPTLESKALELYTHIQMNLNWQSWLREEVEKKLSTD